MTQCLNDKTIADLTKRLEKNAELRHVYARRFNIQTKIAAGSTLYSNQRGIQKIKVNKDGITLNEPV